MRSGMPGSHGNGPPTADLVDVLDPPVEDGGLIIGAGQIPLCCGREPFVTGSAPSAARSSRWPRSVGHAGSSVSPGTNRFAMPSRPGRDLWPDDVLGGDVQGVDVAGDGVAEPDGGVLLLSQQGAGRSSGCRRGPGSARAARWRWRADAVGPDEGVRVAVADDRR